MQPEMPSAHPSNEMGSIPKGGEVAPRYGNAEQNPRQPEAAPGYSESRENLPAPVGGGDQSYSAPSVPVLPPPPLTTSHPVVPQVAADENPIIANDDDLIEKEWVDRAKKIIATTKTDPYMQEKEVSKLQADYLKKRYGKEVALPTE